VRLVLAAVLLVASAAAARAQSLEARLTSALDLLEGTVASSFGRAVPFPSASAGVQYAFDPVTGNFQRNATTFGQVYLDRADPLGKGRMNLSASYAYLELDTLDGKPADDLRDPTPIPFQGQAAAIRINRFFAKAAVHQVLLAFTYGVTDDLETSIALPLVYSNLHVGAEADAAGLLTTGELVREHRDIAESSHPFAQGDLQLRAKYRFLETRWANVAGGLLLRIPTGEEEDLQGIGFLELAPALFASSRIFEAATWARFQVHLNAVAGFDTEDVDQSEIRWGLGLDWGITEQATAAIAILGRNQLARVAPAGVFTFNRCTNATLVECATQQSARRGAAPLFGLDTGRFDYYDLSLGGRAGLWRDTIFGFVNVVVPLNDGFVRTEPIPIVGLEGTF